MGRKYLKVSREIVKQVTNLPIYGEVYRKACEILGVNNSAELAILVVELPLHLPLVRLKGLLGFTPNKNWGRYYHRLRKHISNFVTAFTCVLKGA